MTEDLPLAATTVKGRTRAAMTADLLAAAGAGRVRIAHLQLRARHRGDKRPGGCRRETRITSVLCA